MMLSVPFRDLLLANVGLVLMTIALRECFQWFGRWIAESSPNPDARLRSEYWFSASWLALWFAVAMACTTAVMTIQACLGIDPIHPQGLWRLRLIAWVPSAVAAARFVSVALLERSDGGPPTALGPGDTGDD